MYIYIHTYSIIWLIKTGKVFVEWKRDEELWKDIKIPK